jgi:hypothetical protein
MAILGPDGGRFTPAKKSGGKNTGKGGKGSSGRLKPKTKYPNSSHSSGGGGRGFSSSSNRGRGSGGTSYRPRTSGRMPNRPQNIRAKPVLPMPSADAIADLFNQIAGFKREYSQLGINATAQKSELAAARKLYLKQLADTFAQQKTGALEDFASRGLADSGIAEEGLAKLQNAYAGQQSEYETGYTSRVAEIMRLLQGRRSDILARRQAAERRYNQLRAQRAAALRSAGYGQ